jgi:hypothetical protein
LRETFARRKLPLPEYGASPLAILGGQVQGLGIVAGAAALVGLAVALRVIGRTSRTRARVLDEVRRLMRGGVIESLPGRGLQARGRLGELEATVDLYQDPARTKQSPMWRVLAVGPVKFERPLEARVAGWQGWIDPWMQLGETLIVPAGVGPEFTVHSEHTTTLDHPVVASLRRQGPLMGAGALHVRPDLMRAEVQFRPQPERNRPLFAFLHAMREISEVTPSRHSTTEFARLRRLNITAAGSGGR